MRHNPKQIEWIAAIYGPLAVKFAEIVPVRLAADWERSRTHMSDKHPLAVYYTKSDGASRPTVIHEFTHAYHLEMWPDAVPPKVDVRTLEVAAFAACFRLHRLAAGADTALYLEGHARSPDEGVRGVVQAAWEAESQSAGVTEELVQKIVLGPTARRSFVKLQNQLEARDAAAAGG